MKQSLAIAYAVKRRAKKMARGGMAKTEGQEGYEDEAVHDIGDNEINEQMKHELGQQETDREIHEVGDEEKAMMSSKPSEDHPEYEAHGGDVVDRIMKKRCYSKGGMVANDTPPMADDEKADYDELALDDDLEFHETGKNSGDEDGDHQEDEDRHDIVAKIMRSRRKKDHNPRPA